jgi:hypothetical protein
MRESRRGNSRFFDAIRKDMAVAKAVADFHRRAADEIRSLIDPVEASAVTDDRSAANATEVAR